MLPRRVAFLQGDQVGLYLTFIGRAFQYVSIWRQPCSLYTALFYSVCVLEVRDVLELLLVHPLVGEKRLS